MKYIWYLFSFMTIAGLASTPSLANIVRIDTIEKLQTVDPSMHDTFFVHPDIGSESTKISSERTIAQIVKLFLHNKKATGFELDPQSQTIYYKFVKDPKAKLMEWRDKLGKTAGIKSKLRDLIDKETVIFNREKARG